MVNPEQFKDSGSKERLVDIQEAGEKAAERLKSKHESAPESTEGKQERLTNARQETEAAFAKEAGRERRSGGEPSASPRVINKVTSKQKKNQYKKTLQQTQSHMALPSRTFSKFIHIPAVEKASDAIGSTIARPNAILMGGLFSLVIVTTVYLIAKHYGYSLSGGETIVAFGLGWILGRIIDYARLMSTNRRKYQLSLVSLKTGLPIGRSV